MGGVDAGTSAKEQPRSSTRRTRDQGDPTGPAQDTHCISFKNIKVNENSFLFLWLFVLGFSPVTLVRHLTRWAHE